MKRIIDPARIRWKMFWRKLRLNRPEMRLANEDLMIFGSSFVHFDSEGTARRVHPQDVYVKPIT